MRFLAYLQAVLGYTVFALWITLAMCFLLVAIFGIWLHQHWQQYQQHRKDRQAVEQLLRSVPRSISPYAR